jgi:DNA-binding XRE family transcriptional regulator
LDDKVVAQILWLGLPALFLPEPDQRRLVGAHDDPRVRAAEKLPAVWFMRLAGRDRFRWFEVHFGPLDSTAWRFAPVEKRTNSDRRAALNLTIRGLAKPTGLHRNTITNIEVGRYAGNQDSIALIESVFQKACVEFATEWHTLSVASGYHS